MAAKLIIDMAKIQPQDSSGIRCSYKHHPDNKGIDALLEKIRFALICRRCEAAPCINACPRDALEKIDTGQDDAGILRRNNMLCTGCGSCAIACPFGTVYAELIPFVGSVCDLCRNRLEPSGRPLCVETCSDGSLDYREADGETDLVDVFNGIAVKVAGGVLWEPFLKEKQRD